MEWYIAGSDAQPVVVIFAAICPIVVTANWFNHKLAHFAVIPAITYSPVFVFCRNWWPWVKRPLTLKFMPNLIDQIEKSFCYFSSTAQQIILFLCVIKLLLFFPMQTSDSVSNLQNGYLIDLLLYFLFYFCLFILKGVALLISYLNHNL